MAEHEAFVDELERIVRDEQIDAVLMAGDVYDTVNPPASAEELFYDTLSRLSDRGRVPIVAIAGNHDHPDRLGASAPLAARQGIALLGLPIQRPVTIESLRTGERAIICALPYPSEARLNELLSLEADEALLRSAYSDRVGALVRQQAAAFRPDTVNIVMSHLFAIGGQGCDSERPIEVGGAYTVDTAALCGHIAPFADGLLPQYVALGHLHRAQSLAGPALVRYSGSPLAFSFSEAGQAKSVTIAEIRPGAAPVVTELPLSSGRPLVRWRANGLAEVYAWLDEGRDARAWIELELRMTEALSMEHVHRIRKLHDGVTVIKPVYADLSGQDDPAYRREELPPDELFRRFYTKQTGGAEAEPELVRLFLELLRESDEREEEAG